MENLVSDHPYWTIGLVVSAFLSFRIAFGLWILAKHQARGRLYRLFWTCVAVRPLFGLVLYFGLYRIPKSHTDGGARMHPDTYYGGGP